MLIWESNKNVLWICFNPSPMAINPHQKNQREWLICQKGLKNFKDSFEFYFIIFFITDNPHIFKGKGPLGT